MNNVIPIRGKPLVAALEDWLDRARKGELTAIAFAGRMDDGSCCEGWAGDFDECTLTLYGAINILRDAYFHEHIEHHSTADRGA